MVTTAAACPEKHTIQLRESPATAESEGVRGVVLYVHGLNNNNLIFNSIADELKAQGFHAVFLSLSGHSGRPEDKFCATADLFQQDFIGAYRYITSAYPGMPLSIVAYSLGGVVVTAGLRDVPAKAIQRLVLLAPALSVRPYTQVVRLTFPFAWLGTSLPSMAPEEYSAYASTAIRSYQALFDIRNRAHSYLDSKAKLPPTYIVVHKNDELVSPLGLRALVADTELTNWEVAVVTYKKINPDLNYHHIFAPEAFSEHDRKQLYKQIVAFLTETDGSP